MLRTRFIAHSLPQSNLSLQPIILFPDDAVFRKCKSCPNGRVYYLKFSNDLRDFYWMQDASAVNDDVYCRKLNDIINGVDTDSAGAGK